MTALYKAITPDEICTIIHPITGSITTVKGGYLLSPFFRARELACTSLKEEERGVICVADGVLIRLNYLRLEFDEPMTLTSACRTPVHNKDIGGHTRSLHLTVNAHHNTTGTCAFDVSVEGWSEEKVNRFITLAKKQGFSIGHGYDIVDGVATGFVHIDYRIGIGLSQAEFYY